MPEEQASVANIVARLTRAIANVKLENAAARAAAEIATELDRDDPDDLFVSDASITEQ